MEAKRNTGPVLKVLILVCVFSGSFGLAMDDKGANEPNEPALLVDRLKEAQYSVV